MLATELATFGMASLSQRCMEGYVLAHGECKNSEELYGSIGINAAGNFVRDKRAFRLVISTSGSLSGAIDALFSIVLFDEATDTASLYRHRGWPKLCTRASFAYI